MYYVLALLISQGLGMLAVMMMLVFAVAVNSPRYQNARLQDRL